MIGKPYVSILLLAALAWSCSKPAPAPNKFSDSVLQQIAEFQDRRESDSLIYFFQHENAGYRSAAALAFASVQDTLVSDTLATLLADSDVHVREAAAFALGQTGGLAAYEALKSSAPTTHVKEALGKTALQPGAPMLDGWGLYRLALRGKADSSHVQHALELLDKSNSESDRLAAAHFFARGPSNIDLAAQILQQTARYDSSVYVRMAAASAMRKIKNDDVLITLKEVITGNEDYRVRVNAVRALSSFPVNDVMPTLLVSVKDENEQVTIAATETILQLNSSGFERTLLKLARQTSSWRVKGNLYEAVLSNTPDKKIVDEIVSAFEASENPYEKGGLLTALRQAPSAFVFVRQHLDSPIPIIRSSAAGSLTFMNRHRLFESSMQEAFIDAYRFGMKTGDPAVIGTIADALMNPSLMYKSRLKDFQFLYEAKSKLSLPRDNEALQPLEAAIAYFEDRELDKPITNSYNHPIDWNFVKTIPQDQHVRITTSKGEIVLRLLVEEAPGSVANFLNLANAGYFNGKNFHRVVPNFVIQGGCNRGDGWGSEDYSIRSEFSMRKYKEGSVGMASAGKDTEGTQWFITHSPTPHLDGRYTIFAEVVSGMEVVHRISVGDQIIRVDRL